MREHLYRAKRKDNGEWVYGFYWNRLPYDLYYIRTTDANGNYYDYEIDINTLCEYTGLNDKNLIKIFEGDIVRDDYNHNNEVVYGLNDIYCCGCCFEYHRTIGFYLSHYSEDENTFENICVIGNIYDNAELLEENK